MGAANAGEGATSFRATHENEVGKLQSQEWHNPFEHRSCEEATRLPRIHCGARDDSRLRAYTQPAFHRVDASIPPEVASISGSTEQPTSAERELELLNRIPFDG